MSDESFEQRVRDVVLATLRDPGVLPQEFKGWIPRWVEPLIEVPRSQVVGAYTTAADVAGLGEAVHGRPSTVRAGASPYEFLQMTYDDVYGKWVSGQIWMTLAESSTPSTSWGTVTDAGYLIPNFLDLYDASLRPQVFTGGGFAPAGGATLHLRATIFDAETGGGGATLANAAEISTSSSEFKMSGWQDVTFDSAPTQQHAYVYPQTKRVGGTGGTISRVSVALRWVSS